MKRTMINVEQLPFPSGIAAAETLRSLHEAGAEARRRPAALFTAMGLGGVIGWFRDGIPALIPSYLPITQLFACLGLPRLALLTSPAGYTLTVEASTVYAPPAPSWASAPRPRWPWAPCLNYAILAPRLHEMGIITELGYRGIVSWSVWGGASLMTSAALVNFFVGWRTIARAFSGLGSLFGRRKRRPTTPWTGSRCRVPGSPSASSSPPSWCST